MARLFLDTNNRVTGIDLSNADTSAVAVADSVTIDFGRVLGATATVADNAITALTYLVVPSSVTASVIKSAAVEHARACVDLGNPNWILGNSGAVATNARWKNYRYWVLGPCAIVEAMVDEGANWLERAYHGLLGYQQLIPRDPDKLRFWYLNHGETIYTAYYGALDNGKIRPYFRYIPANGHGLSDYPAFASDASASTPWDGTANTLAVEMDADALPEDFA